MGRLVRQGLSKREDSDIIRRHSSKNIQSFAHFSNCGRYRYLLVRKWSSGCRWMFIGTNPSTADERVNDPTLARIQSRAERAGAGSFSVCNVHALRSTDPNVLLVSDDPTGPGNDSAIAKELRKADLVICGWGNHKIVRTRSPSVLALIRAAGRIPHALKLNADGSPAHPLYLPYSLQPKPMA